MSEYPLACSQFSRFDHYSTKQSVWINGWHTRAQPHRKMQPIKRSRKEQEEEVEEQEEEGDDGEEEQELSPEEKKNIRKVRGILNKAQAREDQKPAALASCSHNQHQKLQQVPHHPHALAALLKACAKQKDLHQGILLHADIVGKGLLTRNGFLASTLVSMYAKCGSLAKSQNVFDKLPIRDVVSWNALIAGYSQHGYGEQAVECFQQMQLEGIFPNAVTYICILKACGSIGDVEKGKEIHADIARAGLLEKDIIVGTALVDMYAKCNQLRKAQEVFDKLPARNVVSWNALIAGYAQQGYGEQAMNCFDQMKFDNVSPDAVTFVCILKACGCMRTAGKGKEIHAEIIREKLLDKDVVVGTALVDMYAKCGLLEKALEVFDKLPIRNVVSWNALVAGYVQHGHSHQAFTIFKRMQLECLSPDAVTYICILKACGSIQDAERGKRVHADIVTKGSLGNCIIVGTALVDMYAKCGLLAEAQEVFDKLPVVNVVLWNALIAGYVQNGDAEKALECFKQMKLEGLTPDSITIVCTLKACGSIGAAGMGRDIHAEIIREGSLESDIDVGMALVDMYAKCGLLANAQEVFDKLPMRNVEVWSTLMSGYALLGKVEYVFDLFDKMIVEGTKPDSIVLTIVLNACCHAGLVAKGQVYFQMMSSSHDVKPTLEHYTCMVNLFARSGHLDMALAVIKDMPFSADPTVWLILLGACQKWGNFKLGRLAFEHLVQLDEQEAAAYICMSNVYATAGRQKDADKVETMRVRATNLGMISDQSTVL